MSRSLASIAVRAVRSVALLAIALPAAACGGSSSSSTSSPDPSGGPAAPAYDANGCVAPADGVQPGAICVKTLSAHVLDLEGAPLPNLVTTACGDGCSFGKTDGTGATKMDVHRYMRKAALMLHGRSHYASYYSRFDATGDVDKGTLFLPTMPFEEGVDLPVDGKAKVVTHGDVTYSFANGMDVNVDQIELDGAAEQRFRAIKVALDKAPPFVDPKAGFAALYAMTPFHTRIKPAAAVTIANTAKLPAGAAVELFVQLTDLQEKLGPFGGFTKVADGHVSADGAAIKTDDGQGIPEITWLGVRLKSGGS